MELTLCVDHDCNLRCSYCYNGGKFSRLMPAEVMRRSVDLALASPPGQLDVSFFGGEPLLHPGFIEETLAHVEAAVQTRPEPRPHIRYRLCRFCPTRYISHLRRSCFSSPARR